MVHTFMRIGVDLDRPSDLELLKAYVNASMIAPTELYRTRRGYHLKILVEADPETNLKIRRLLGDDPRRLEIDEARVLSGSGMHIDVLFTSKFFKIRGKWVRVSGEEREDPRSLFAAHFFSRTSRRWYVCGRSRRGRRRRS